MGIYKKALICLLNDIKDIQNNNNFDNKVKYIECRITGISYYDHINEDIELIKKNIKQVNIKIINNIDFKLFISELLSIIHFFKEDYIYFKNNKNN